MIRFSPSMPTPADIRHELIRCFDEEELIVFCADHFPEVQADWATHDSLSVKTRILVQHCQRRDQLDALVAKINAERPNAFTQAERGALCQLRPGNPTFVGREDDIANLLAQIKSGQSVVAIEGMGGVGKSELAHRVANLLMADYPDAQLVIPLGAHSGNTPMTAQQALEYVLNRLHPEAKLPDDVTLLQGLYWQALRPKRAILILDDASDDTQIAPLLPPPPGILILVTARGRLESAPLQHLSALPTAQAIQLLRHYRPALSDADAQALAEAASGLPIA